MSKNFFAILITIMIIGTINSNAQIGSFLKDKALKAAEKEVKKKEGILADAMSPGEIFLLEKAGFKHSEIFYIGNNVSAEEMQYAIDRDILVSVDSLSQLERFGTINRGGRVAVRFNPGLGAGHCEQVVTVSELISIQNTVGWPHGI